MTFCIQNEFLTVTAAALGAELQSILASDGTEYLWQGDPTYWEGRAPNLFPYIARMTQGSYYLDGTLHHMKHHGIAMYRCFRLVQKDGASMTFELTDDGETYETYPRHFAFRITYTLHGNRLDVCYEVENRDERLLYFGIGGHPGFNVPLKKGLSFSDYRIRFAEPCMPVRVGLSEDNFVTGQDSNYPLTDNRDLPLRHELFDGRTIILREHVRQVTLESDKDPHRVTLSCPQMPYLGIWHLPHTEAPYVCLEPWGSLQSSLNQITVLEEQLGLIHLEPGKTYRNLWSMSFDTHSTFG